MLKEYLFKTDYVRTFMREMLNFFKRINFIVSEYKVHHKCIQNRFNGLNEEIWKNCINSLNTWFTEKYKGRKLPHIAMEVMCIPD